MTILLTVDAYGDVDEDAFGDAVESLCDMDVDTYTDDPSIGFYSYGSARECDTRPPVSVVDGHEDIRLIVAGADKGARVGTMIALFESVGVCDKADVPCRLVTTSARDDGASLEATISWATVEEGR